MKRGRGGGRRSYREDCDDGVSWESGRSRAEERLEDPLCLLLGTRGERRAGGKSNGREQHTHLRLDVVDHEGVSQVRLVPAPAEREGQQAGRRSPNVHKTDR